MPSKFGRKLTFQQPLVLDKFSHPRPEHLLPLLLSLAAFEKHPPQPIDLIFDALRMLDQLMFIFAKCVLLFLRVFLVLAKVVGDLNEPYALEIC